MPRRLRIPAPRGGATRPLSTPRERNKRWRYSLPLLIPAAISWPGSALAATNPTRPPWNPGVPWAPLTPASGEMHMISDLFWVMLVLSGIIFFGVMFALLYSVVRFSAKPGAPEPPQVYGNRTVELLWTLAPSVVLLIAFVFTVKYIHDINNPQSGRIMNIYAIGHQWWWEFQYPKQPGIPTAIVTATELHVPTGVNLHFHITSADVIHSFWVPRLQRQIDANPGIDNAVFVKLNQPGIYAGDCYEYCGTAHAWMKFREVVQTPSQFAAWVHSQEQAAATPAPGSLAARGEYIFLHNTCVNCHAISGTSAAGVVGPNLTHLASRWAFAGASAPMTTSALEHWVNNPTYYKPGVLMPGYPLLSSSDLHALATYLMSLK